MILFSDVRIFYFMVKVELFNKNQPGIAAWWQKVAEMGQKWLLLAKK